MKTKKSVLLQKIAELEEQHLVDVQKIKDLHLSTTRLNNTILKMLSKPTPVVPIEATIDSILAKTLIELDTDGIDHDTVDSLDTLEGVRHSFISTRK